MEKTRTKYKLPHADLNKTELEVRQVMGSRRLFFRARYGPLEETLKPSATVNGGRSIRRKQVNVNWAKLHEQFDAPKISTGQSEMKLN
jgi:hypothetical protein